MKSKTTATWLAVLGGGLGLHRAYLYGWARLTTWVHLPLTLLGVAGLVRSLTLGQDDQVAWLLLPIGGLSLSAAMLTAIVYGLTPDERWNARHNGTGKGTPPAGWSVVLGVIAALLVGATILMSTIAFGLQRYFETTLASDAAAGQATTQNSPALRK